MAYSQDSGNGPSPSRRERRFRLSGTAVLLAVAISAAVLFAGAAGLFTAPVAAAAVCGACLIAAISARHSGPLAELLEPLTDGETRTVVIAAPLASEVAAGQAGRSDAA